MKTIISFFVRESDFMKNEGENATETHQISSRKNFDKQVEKDSLIRCPMFPFSSRSCSFFTEK